MAGRSIRIFLVDGKPTGIRTLEVGLSTIIGIFGPRSSLDALSRRAESRRTGIYVLEASLVTLARDAKRATVFNKNQPIGGTLPEADMAEMDEFLEQARLLLATLGVSAFEPKHVSSTTKPAAGSSATAILEMSGKGYSARCAILDGEFVVLKNSVARLNEAATLAPSSKSLRTELLQSGILATSKDGNVFTQDYAFGSSSGAAQVVCGANVSGRKVWKLEGSATTLGDWQDGLVAQPYDGPSTD